MERKLLKVMSGTTEEGLDKSDHQVKFIINHLKTTSSWKFQTNNTNLERKLLKVMSGTTEEGLDKPHHQSSKNNIMENSYKHYVTKSSEISKSDIWNSKRRYR